MRSRALILVAVSSLMAGCDGVGRTIEPPDEPDNLASYPRTTAGTVERSHQRFANQVYTNVSFETTDGAAAVLEFYLQSMNTEGLEIRARRETPRDCYLFGESDDGLRSLTVSARKSSRASYVGVSRIDPGPALPGYPEHFDWTALARPDREMTLFVDRNRIERRESGAAIVWIRLAPDDQPAGPPALWRVECSAESVRRITPSTGQLDARAVAPADVIGGAELFREVCG